jgi:hypothetical protein|tara:strand:- start:1788 stop:2174 length:387 start_codon:yes stop_codon:yes gene_type:complete
MAHYARVNSENIVLYVTPIPNEMITDENGVEHEERAFEHLYATIPDSVGDTWVQTSYNNNLRGRYAGIGYTWDADNNVFISPQPYPSWTLNTETFEWDPPSPMPEQTLEEMITYSWNEETQSWEPNKL